jgi:pyridoxamine 5'-phosphate oxidase
MSSEGLLGSHRDYKKSMLTDRNLNPDPVAQFGAWFAEASGTDIPDPNAMALSTVDASGRPSSRIVLLKGFDPRGFVFYTNYKSRKGIELDANPYASLLFFWDKLERQIRIEGSVVRTSHEESDKYYQTRPYTSRLGAWASKQSETLSSRFRLMREVAGLIIKYPVNTPLPPFWGGYRLVPDVFEFWQGRESRLHDRFRYALRDGVWEISRLYP